MQDTLHKGMELSRGENVYRTMTNSSGSTLADGTVVIIDTTDSTGRSVTLPTAEADPQVFGVVVHPNGKTYTYAIGATDVLVCDRGVARVKVNGTDDIAAGNPLRVYDTNGIGYLAVAGTTSLSCTFGTALEAYTGNNSSGYINAFIGLL